MARQRDVLTLHWRLFLGEQRKKTSAAAPRRRWNRDGKPARIAIGPPVISLASSCPHLAHRSLHPLSLLRILMPADSTSKRLRDADASDAGVVVKSAKGGEANDPPASSSSFTTFSNLPPELRSLVLQYAYQEEDQEGMRTNVKTLHRLVLVSRSLHSTLTPVLYANVKITQPSVLSDFHRSLCLRPSNAGLVRSLHLGQLADLNSEWWPIRGMRDSYYNPEATDEEPLAYLKTSWSERDEAMRPRWCKPHQEWVHHNPTEPGPTVIRTCHEQAVTDAISAALKRVGVSLYPEEYADCDSIEDADGRFVDLVSVRSMKQTGQTRSPGHIWRTACRTNGPFASSRRRRSWIYTLQR